MKIIVFTHSITHSAGGVRDAVLNLFNCATLRSVDIEVLTFRQRDTEKESMYWEIPVHALKAKPLQLFGRAKRALLHSNADILHMHALWRIPHLWMRSWMLQTGKPIVCTPHGMLDPYIIKNQGALKRLIARLFFDSSLRAVDCFHALCLKEMEDVRAYGLKQPIAIIPNGVHLPDENIRYEKTDKKHHLLYLGRLHKKKGVDLLLNAIAKIKKEHPHLMDQWQVDIVGWDDGNEAKALKRIASRNQLDDLVIFHGGLFGEAKQRMYATCDAYILPSHGEGLPLTVLEAWAWKKPVIMTSHCHIPEGFDADAAIQIDDTIDGTMSGLLKLLTMPDEERCSMGNRGYKLVRTSFTWEESARKLKRLYEWILGQGDKPEFVYL